MRIVDRESVMESGHDRTRVLALYGSATNRLERMAILNRYGHTITYPEWLRIFDRYGSVMTQHERMRILDRYVSRMNEHQRMRILERYFGTEAVRRTVRSDDLENEARRENKSGHQRKKVASKSDIREVARLLYSQNPRQPPNNRRAPPRITEELAKKGMTTKRETIREVLDEGEFKSRRRLPGKRYND